MSTMTLLNALIYSLVTHTLIIKICVIPSAPKLRLGLIGRLTLRIRKLTDKVIVHID